MALRINTKMIHKVDAFDLDEFIAESYGLPAFECTLESPNDSSHSFNVSPDPLDKYDADKVAKYVERKNCEVYALGRILDDLCGKGLIPAGEYIVSVSW